MRLNKKSIKTFWMAVLLIMFLIYLYYYKYGNNEGFTIPGTELVNSVTRDIRKTTESISETIGPEVVTQQITAMQYRNNNASK